MNEAWVAVPCFEHYEVSSLGRFRRVLQSQGAKAGRILSWHLNTSSGYATIRFRLGGKAVTRTVHSLVALAFHGQRAPGLVVRHLDGDKLNNCASNLAYGTQADNGADMVRHGTSLAGAKNPKAKLSIEQVERIRSDYGFGLTAKELSNINGVCESTVYRIVSGVYWKTEASNRAIDKAAQ